MQTRKKHLGATPLAILCAAALILAAGTRQASASLQLTIGNPGLTHFDSDGGVELDFGLTDQSGQPVGNLRPENVQVFEDGKPAKIIDFRGVGQGRPVDIVFVMDVTESMQPYIDAIKQNMITFAQDLNSNNRDYRLGLVTFEDYVVSKYPDCNCEYRNKMTSNVQQFISWVGTLHAGGGGDIPEDQLDALAYASTLPFRPDAQSILILITDAPSHHAGDGGDRQGDQAYRDHHPADGDVTDLTGDKVATMLQKQGLTLYGVVPPPFIAPEYKQVADATHGRLYNIISEENRFSELVREIGHSIATEYSLTYRTPRPIEDGTDRAVELKVNYNGEGGSTSTSYQVRGVGGAAINVPEEGSSVNGGTEGAGLTQVSFSWWNGAVPLIAILSLIGLSRMRFGIAAEELKAIVEAQSRAPAPNIASAARQMLSQRGRPGASQPAPRSAQPPVAASRLARPGAPMPAGGVREARLTTIEPMDPIANEYALLKEEVSLGRSEDNDIVIPHASISRAHARLVRRDGAYELVDLNSTNGSYVNNQPVHGSAMVSSGSEVRFGDIRFDLNF
jgi:FHA domain-containing protein/integrin beta-like protein